jgi:hypothetical protein
MPGNLSAPVAPILLRELLVTADQEEAPKRLSVHFNNSDSKDGNPLVPLDNTPVVGAPVAPPAVPGVPLAPQQSLTPPAVKGYCSQMLKPDYCPALSERFELLRSQFGQVLDELWTFLFSLLYGLC